jgi:hypothetical protein
MREIPSNQEERSTLPNALQLTSAECQVILAIRMMTYGSVEIRIENGIPVYLEKVREKQKLV